MDDKHSEYLSSYNYMFAQIDRSSSPWALVFPIIATGIKTPVLFYCPWKVDLIALFCWFVSLWYCVSQSDLTHIQLSDEYLTHVILLSARESNNWWCNRICYKHFNINIPCLLWSSLIAHVCNRLIGGIFSGVLFLLSFLFQME